MLSDMACSIFVSLKVISPKDHKQKWIVKNQGNEEDDDDSPFKFWLLTLKGDSKLSAKVTLPVATVAEVPTPESISFLVFAANILE